jgi:hypothetical protein
VYYWCKCQWALTSKLMMCSLSSDVRLPLNLVTIVVTSRRQ